MTALCVLVSVDRNFRNFGVMLLEGNVEAIGVRIQSRGSSVILFPFRYTSDSGASTAGHVGVHHVVMNLMSAAQA